MVKFRHGRAAERRSAAQIIEILSPSTETETRENVWAYLSIPSVREVLLVRSTEIGAELSTRQADGSWPANSVSIVASEGIVRGAATSPRD